MRYFRHAGPARRVIPDPMGTSTNNLLQSIHTITVQIGAARHVDEVYDAALDGLCAILGASRASVVTPDAQHVLRCRATRGLSDAYRVAMEAAIVPSTRELENESVVLEDVTALPDDQTRAVLLAEGIRALAYVPLNDHERLIGKLFVYFDTPHVFTEDELLVAKLLARQVSFAMVQLGLTEELRRSRDDLSIVLQGVADGITAQAADGTILFANDGDARLVVNIYRDVTEKRREDIRREVLLEAVDLAGTTLDAASTIERLARLVVPRLADMCVVVLSRPEGGTPPFAAAHADPSLEPALRETMLRLTRPNVLNRGATQGLHEIYADADAEVRTRDDTPEMQSLLATLTPRASITAPIRCPVGVLGSITLARTEQSGEFAPDELAFATDLAQRVGLALDNARLYREAQQTRERLEGSLLASGLGTWKFDLATGSVVWSDTIAAIHGRRIEDIGGNFQAFLDDVHPLDRDYVQRQITGTLASGVRHEICYRIVRPTGEERWVEGRGQVHRDLSGAPTGMSGVCMDVTDRKLAEIALAAERERLSVTLSSIADAVISTDTDGRIDLINEVGEVLTGWSRAEAVGRPLGEVLVLSALHVGDTQDLVEQVRAAGAAVPLAQDVVLTARGGACYRVEGRAAPERDADGRLIGIVVGLRDVTARRRLEEELRKASKLESLGVLAGGIAHDFNNILTSVVVNLSLADRKMELDHAARSNTGAATRACERAQELTRQLLTFARGGEPVKAPTALTHLLRESCAFALQGSKCRAVVAAPTDLWPVDADAGQIGQVVHNLALNAHQAMPEGGTVAVQARNIEVGLDYPLPLPPGRYVAVSVSDRGPGIPAETLLRVFDPFFSTKSTGSGLGLATSYSILKRHDGHIAAESPPGGGAVFTFHLPAANAPVEIAPELARPVVSQGRGRVLVMDDDEWIRRLALECLQVLGYEAEAAPGGEEAIAQWRAAAALGTPFDVVIMDLTVPGGVGGSEALARLRSLDPRVRAIVSSGYSDDPVLARYADHGFRGIIRKPFRLEDLGRAVAGVLERAD